MHKLTLVIDDPVLLSQWEDAVKRSTGVVRSTEEEADAVITYTVSAVQKSMQHGLHVLVCFDEIIDSSVLEELNITCQKAPVQLMVASHLRFSPAFQQICNSLETGQLGEPGVVRIHRWLPSAKGDMLARLTDEIDLAIGMFGVRPNTVYGFSNGDEESYVHAHLGFPDGGMALIDVSLTLPPGDDYYSFSLIGSDGSAYADDHHNVHLMYAGGLPCAHRNPTDPVLNRISMLEAFSRLLTGTETVTCDIPALLSARKVTATVVQSIQSNQSWILSQDGETYVCS